MATLQSAWDAAKEKGGTVLNIVIYPLKMLWDSFWDIFLYGEKRSRNIIRFLTTGAGVAAGWYNPSVDPALRKGVSWFLSKVYDLEVTSTPVSGASQTAFPFHAMWFGGLLGATLSKWTYQIFTYFRSRNGRKITNSRYFYPTDSHAFRRVAAYYGNLDDPENIAEVQKCLDGMIGVIKMFKESPELMATSTLNKAQVKEHLHNYINGDPSGYYNVFVNEVADARRIAERQQAHQREWYERLYGQNQRPTLSDRPHEDMAAEEPVSYSESSEGDAQAAPDSPALSAASPQSIASSQTSKRITHVTKGEPATSPGLTKASPDSIELSDVQTYRLDYGCHTDDDSDNLNDGGSLVRLDSQEARIDINHSPQSGRHSPIQHQQVLDENKERDSDRERAVEPSTSVSLRRIPSLEQHEARRRSYVFSSGPFGLFQRRAQQKVAQISSLATMLGTFDETHTADIRDTALPQGIGERTRRIEYKRSQ